jgi:hypothetical protein
MDPSNNPAISSEPTVSKKKIVKKRMADIPLPTVEELEKYEQEEIKNKESIKMVVEEKPKRGQSEKTKLALAKGREKLAELNKQRKAERESLVNEKINKKAERIAEQKVKMLKDLNLDEEDSDEDIIAKPVKVSKTASTPIIKKKKAPRVVYVDEEEESEEEEVVYRSRTVPKKKVSGNSIAVPFSGIQFY